MAELTSWPVGRRSDADQQGRWSLPARMVFAGGWGMAVGGGVDEEKGTPLPTCHLARMPPQHLR